MTPETQPTDGQGAQRPEARPDTRQAHVPAPRAPVLPVPRAPVLPPPPRPPPALATWRTRWANRGPWPGRIGKTLLALAALPFVLSVFYILLPPPVTMVQLERIFAGDGFDRHIVQYSQISPLLARAVVTSEDARFCQHNGIDWVEFQYVLDDVADGEKPTRGASTLTMQTAKNLFLSDNRSILRKGAEVPLAYWIDLVLTKRRILEIYLNNVEWGPGIFGAEAAARHYFHKSAATLTRREAALLAAVLPNPIRRNAGKPSKNVNRIATRIMLRMGTMTPYLACLRD